jgi:acetyltransferase-like isoleucine patch superfamily enzyme
MKWVVRSAVSALIWVAYRAYRAEGINALLLVMPARFIAPVLRQHGARIGERVEIHSPLIIHNAASQPGKHYNNLTIGDDSYLGRDVFLDLTDEIRIQDCVTISMRVTLITHTDLGKSPSASRFRPSHAPVILKRGAYLGAGVLVLQGVEIGESAVIGAGAVVTTSAAPGAVLAGVPARDIHGQGPNFPLVN